MTFIPDLEPGNSCIAKKPSGRGSGDKRKKSLPVPGSTTVVLYVGWDSANVSFCAM